MQAFLGLTVALSAWAADPAHDLLPDGRTVPIRKLPALSSPTPRYCLIVFGRDARTRMWVVVDDRRLFIDRNGNGDLTEPGEMIENGHRSFNVGRVVESDGKTTHEGFQIRGGYPDANVTVKVHGKWEQRAFRDARGKLKFGDSPAAAPVVHLNGPVTMAPFWTQRPLRSSHHEELSIVVGTPGKGPGSFATYLCECFLHGGAAPEADIEFPNREPGRPPIWVRVRLNEDGGVYPLGLVQAPPQAGKGMARVTLTFHSWRGMEVRPAVIQVPVNP